MLVFVRVCMQSLWGVHVLIISYTCGEKNCSRPGLVGKMVLLSVRACVQQTPLQLSSQGRLGVSDIQHIKRNSDRDCLRLLFHLRSH